MVCTCPRNPACQLAHALRVAACAWSQHRRVRRARRRRHQSTRLQLHASRSDDQPVLERTVPRTHVDEPCRGGIWRAISGKAAKAARASPRSPCPRGARGARHRGWRRRHSNRLWRGRNWQQRARRPHRSRGQSGGRSQPTRQGAVVRHLPLEACGSGRCHLPLPGPGLSHYLEPPRARLVAARAHLLERLLASVSAMAAGPAHAAARLVTVVARLAAKETAAWEQQHARLFLALPVGCAARSPPALRGRHRHAHDAAAPATPHGEPAKLAQLPLLGQRSLELVIVVCQPVLFAEATEAEPSGYDLHERGLRHFA